MSLWAKAPKAGVIPADVGRLIAARAFFAGCGGTIRDDATAGAASGEAASVVRNNLYTVKGCRPVSVVIQPASTATNPAGPIANAQVCSRRD
ncbi:MAG: hypothetical protein NVS1B6_20310 [Steroidobacteraceae bacterium]